MITVTGSRSDIEDLRRSLILTNKPAAELVREAHQHETTRDGEPGRLVTILVDEVDLVGWCVLQAARLRCMVTGPSLSCQHCGSGLLSEPARVRGLCHDCEGRAVAAAHAAEVERAVARVSRTS